MIDKMQLMINSGLSVQEICQHFGITTNVFYRKFYSSLEITELAKNNRFLAKHGDKPYFQLLEKYGPARISKEYGVNVAHVVRLRNILGIKFLPKRPNQKSETGQVAEMYLSGKTQTEISNELNISKQRVHQILKKKNLLRKKEIPEFVKFLGTCPDSVLANEYNVSKTTIQEYRKKANIPPYKVIIPVEELSQPNIVLETKYNIGSKTIASLRKKHGVVFKNKERNFIPISKEDFESMSITDIAKKYQCSKNRVCALKRKFLEENK